MKKYIKNEILVQGSKSSIRTPPRKMKSYKKQLHKSMKGDYDDWTCPTKESMNYKVSNGWLREGYGKLNHISNKIILSFIKKNINRNWDDVYSELCETLSGNGYVQYVIKDNLKYMFGDVAEFIDGKPYEIDMWCQNGLQAMKSFSERDLTFYVDKQGLLQAAPFIKKTTERKPEITLHKNKKDFYAKYKGKWHKILLKPIKEMSQNDLGSQGKYYNYKYDYYKKHIFWRCESVFHTSITKLHSKETPDLFAYKKKLGNIIRYSDIKLINSRTLKKLKLKND